MGKDERGYIVVETIGSFLLFVLLVLSILSLINIVAVQARIHYALTQAAQTISMYSYTLDVIGVADAVANNAAQAERVEQESDEFKQNLSQLFDGFESLDIAEIGSSGEALADQTGGWASDAAADPESSIQALLNYALRESGNAVFGDLVRPLVGHYLYNGSMSGEEYLQAEYRDTLTLAEGLEGESPEDKRMREMFVLNYFWFMQTLLDRKDRMSMYHGLEVRVPFCDYRIAEYLYGVPWEFKDYQGREKGLLRRAVEGLLPEQVLYRKKSPYPKTFDPRYAELISHRMQELLEKDAPLWQLVSKEAVKTFLHTDSPWPWYGQLMRKPQTMAYFLQLDFWLRHYQVEFCF